MAVSVLEATLGRAGRGIDRYGMRGFATRATLRGLRPVLAPVAARRLRAAGELAPDLDALVDVPFSLAPLLRGECRGSPAHRRRGETPSPGS